MVNIALVFADKVLLHEGHIRLPAPSVLLLFEVDFELAFLLRLKVTDINFLRDIECGASLVPRGQTG